MSEAAQGEVIYVLKKPLKVGKGADEKVITELTLREPTAGEMSAAEQFAKKGQTEQAIQLLALVSNVHFSVLKNLGGRDFKEASEILGSFFEDGPTTGANS